MSYNKNYVQKRFTFYMQTPLKNSAFLYIDPLINFSLNIKQHYTICIFYMYAILQLSHVFHNHKRSLVFYYLQGQRPTQRVPDLHVPLAPTLTSTVGILRHSLQSFSGELWCISWSMQISVAQNIKQSLYRLKECKTK